MGAENSLTDPGYWDSYWGQMALPQEIVRGRSYYLNQILDVIDVHLGSGHGRSALEIGGAPGQYLVYVAKTLGYEISCLDYSAVGCQKTRENLKMLGLTGEVYQGDLFSADAAVPLFDVVYSLGLIEHFVDLVDIIGRHLRFLKPGGVLLVGCPNLTGIYHVFMRFLAPTLLAKHNLDTMRLSRWAEFEERFGLEVLFKAYVGGFEPRMLEHCERDTAFSRLLLRVVRLLERLVDDYPNRLRVLRHSRSRLASGYLMGVYKKPMVSGRYHRALRPRIPAL